MTPQVKSLAYRQDFSTPWHRLGTPVIGHQSAQELAVAADMDFEYRLMPNVAIDPDSPVHEDGTMTVTGYVPTGSGTIFSNQGGLWQPISTVKKMGNYEVVQNMQIAEILDTANGDQKALSEVFEMDVAGVLAGGRHAFFCMKMGEDTIKLGNDGDDHYISYTTVYNDYANNVLQWMISVVRVVCINTAQMAISDATKKGTIWNFSHRSNPLAFLKYRASLEQHLQNERISFYKQLQGLLDVKWDQQDVTDFANALYPDPPKPKKKIQADAGRDFIEMLDPSVYEPVMAMGDNAETMYQKGLVRADEYRKGVTERVHAYADEFDGYTMYAGWQAATDFINWREPERGDWNRVAESVLFDSRRVEMDRLMKITGFVKPQRRNTN